MPCLGIQQQMTRPILLLVPINFIGSDNHDASSFLSRLHRIPIPCMVLYVQYNLFFYLQDGAILFVRVVCGPCDRGQRRWGLHYNDRELLLQGRHVPVLWAYGIPRPPYWDAPIRLSFSGCTFNEITEADLPMLYHSAETLIIHNSQITKIHDRVFHLFTNLKTLSLENNFITNITKATLSGLDGLEMLNLNGNRLTMLHTDALSSTPALKEIQLGHNENLELPDDLFDGINLTTLRLSFWLSNSTAFFIW